MSVSPYARRLADVALMEHETYSGIVETDPRLRKHIYDVYLKDLAAADPRDSLGWNMPSNITQWAWSATFVSWCALKAGAKVAEFDFSVRHAVYVRFAIRNADRGEGVFRAHEISAYAPQLGDMISANRGGGSVTYAQARDLDSYNSHTAIVVDFVTRGGKRYAVTVGGNEGDSVRRAEVELDPQGFVRRRAANPFICVIQTLKDDAPAAEGPSPQVAARGLPASCSGHGAFFYDAAKTMAEYGSGRRAAEAMVRAGMAHAWVRVHGRQPFDAARKAATRDLIAALKDAGIAVAGWGWNQGEDPATEAATAVRELAAYGLVDYVADIEPGHNNSVWTTDEIDSFCRRVRAKVSGAFGVSSFALVDWHEPHLMRATLPHVDFLAPQIYWFDFPNQRMVDQFRRPDGSHYGKNDPGAYADLCLDRWRALAAASPKPLVLTGQAYWGEGNFDQASAERRLRQFLAGWSGYDGLAGLNWWHFGGGDGMSHDMLEAIVAADLGAHFGVPTLRQVA